MKRPFHKLVPMSGLHRSDKLVICVEIDSCVNVHNLEMRIEFESIPHAQTFDSLREARFTYPRPGLHPHHRVKNFIQKLIRFGYKGEKKPDSDWWKESGTYFFFAERNPGSGEGAGAEPSEASGVKRSRT